MAQITVTCIKHTESGKSAFCRATTKVGWANSTVGVGYVRPAEGESLPDIGASFTFEGTIELRVMQDTNPDTGEVTTRMTKEGIPLNELVLKPA